MRANRLSVGVPFLLVPALALGGCANNPPSDAQFDGGEGGASAETSTDATVSDGTAPLAESSAGDALAASDTTLSGDSSPAIVPDGSAIDGGSSDGTTAASDAPTATGDGSMPTGCAGLPFCDDFESDTVGAAPSAALWSIVTGCGQNDPASTVTVDDTQQHSGKNAVKVVGGTNTCGPIFSNTSAFKSLGASIYGRFYARFSVATQTSHSMFMGLGFETDGSVPAQVNDNLEMTGQYGVYVWNLHDTTLPNTAPSASTPQNTWACFEFHTDATTGDLDTWVGGPAPTAPMTFDPGTTTIQAGVNSSWAAYARPSPFQPTSISFGWVTFGGSAATVWFDDIALSTSALPCD